MSMNPQKLAYGPEAAAEALGVSRSRIFAAISSGELKSYLDGKRRLISAKSLSDYVAKKELGAQGRAAA